MYDTTDRLSDVQESARATDLTVEVAGWQLAVFLVLGSWFPRSRLGLECLRKEALASSCVLPTRNKQMGLKR